MSEDLFRSTFSPEEIAAMRRAGRDEASVGRDLFALLRRIGRRVPFAEDALAAWFCATDPATERRVKLVLIGALAYFVMPADLMPDILPLVGFTDDAAVVAAALAAVTRAMRPEHRDRARQALEETGPAA